MSTSKQVVPVFLRDLLDELIGEKEYHEFRTDNILQTLMLVDSKEDFCHIDFPSKDNPIRAPRLYHKSEWMRNVERHERMRVACAEDNRVIHELDDTRVEIRAKLADLLCINMDSKTQVAKLNALVEKAMDARAKGISELLGVDLTVLPQAPYKVRKLK